MKLTQALVAAVLCVLALGAAAADEKDKELEKAEIRKMCQDSLDRLYSAQPAARSAVRDAAGYAVFSNTGVKILFAGSGKGKGVAVNNSTKNETFMNMLEFQGGLGFGVKKFTVVFLFANDKVMNNFVNSGWQFGGQASAAAKTSPEKGGSMQGATAVSEGIYMYQLTDKGLAAEITMKGTKYSKDKDLN